MLTPATKTAIRESLDFLSGHHPELPQYHERRVLVVQGRRPGPIRKPKPEQVTIERRTPWTDPDLADNRGWDEWQKPDGSRED